MANINQKEVHYLNGSNNHKIVLDINYSNQKSSLVAVFVHGFKGFKDWGTHNLVSDFFVAHDINYVKFNFSHSGADPKNPVDVNNLNLFAKNTPSKELHDLDIVIDFVKQKFPTSEIILIGHSRGGGISILKTAKDKRINKLITWAAIDSFSSLWKKEQEAEWKANGKIDVYNARTKEYMPLDIELLEDVQQHQEKLNIVMAASAINKPWLIIHGNNDINVAISVGRNFNEINKRSIFKEIDGANHVFGASHPYTGQELPNQLKEVCDACVGFIKTKTNID